jgi:hypothetical protein
MRLRPNSRFLISGDGNPDQGRKYEDGQADPEEYCEGCQPNAQPEIPHIGLKAPVGVLTGFLDEEEPEDRQKNTETAPLAIQSALRANEQGCDRKREKCEGGPNQQGKSGRDQNFLCPDVPVGLKASFVSGSVRAGFDRCVVTDTEMKDRCHADEDQNRSDQEPHFWKNPAARARIQRQRFGAPLAIFTPTRDSSCSKLTL